MITVIGRSPREDACKAAARLARTALNGTPGCRSRREDARKAAAARRDGLCAAHGVGELVDASQKAAAARDEGRCGRRACTGECVRATAFVLPTPSAPGGSFSPE